MGTSLFVSGPLALVAAGFFAYLVVSWLRYQQEAGRMETREAQLLQHCELNTRASELAREKTALALERCRELEKALPGLRQQLTLLRGAHKENAEGNG